MPTQRADIGDWERLDTKPLLSALAAVKRVISRSGCPSRGQASRTAKIVNTMVDQLGSLASEVTRVAREVETEGKLGGQAGRYRARLGSHDHVFLQYSV